MTLEELGKAGPQQNSNYYLQLPLMFANFGVARRLLEYLATQMGWKILSLWSGTLPKLPKRKVSALAPIVQAVS
jgi:hypothetical protein